MALVCAQAALYAARNRATITGCEHDQYDIKVQVVGNDQLQKIGDTEKLDGDHAKAKARATPWSFSGGGILGAGGGGLPIGGGGGGSLMGANPRMAVYVDVAAKQFNLHVVLGPAAQLDHRQRQPLAARDGLRGRPQRRPGRHARASPSTPRRTGAASSRSSSTRRWASGSRTASRSRSPSGAPPSNAQHFDHVHLADTDPPDAEHLDDAGPAKPGSGAGGDGAVGGGGGGFGGLGGFGLEVHLVRWDGQGGRVGDIPGAPDSIPANLRQLFFNVMICESGGDPHATEDPGGQRRAARALRPLPVRHPDVGVGRRSRRPERRIARGAVDARVHALPPARLAAVGVRRREPPRLRVTDERLGGAARRAGGGDARRRPDADRRAQLPRAPARPGQDDAAAAGLRAADPQVQLDPHDRHALRPGPRVAGPRRARRARRSRRRAAADEALRARAFGGRDGRGRRATRFAAALDGL